MKIAPSVETLTAVFPNKDHQIDSIEGLPERIGLNVLFEALTENAASIQTLKGGRQFGHMAFCMSAPQYATIHHSLPFVLQPPPGELTFEANDTAAIRDDKNLCTSTKSTTSNWKPT